MLWSQPFAHTHGLASPYARYIQARALSSWHHDVRPVVDLHPHGAPLSASDPPNQVRYACLLSLISLAAPFLLFSCICHARHVHDLTARFRWRLFYSSFVVLDGCEHTFYFQTPAYKRQPPWPPI